MSFCIHRSTSEACYKVCSKHSYYGDENSIPAEEIPAECHFKEHELKCGFNGVAEEPDRVVESNFVFLWANLFSLWP